MYHKVTTLTEFIISEQRQHEDASGGFTLLLTTIENSCKVIASHIKKTGLVDIIGAAGGQNVYGEEVQKLDEFANRLLIDTLLESGLVYAIGSEELDEPIFAEDSRGDYVVYFDPLDGSSNITTNVSIGTIFSIYHAPSLATRTKGVKDRKEILQKGEKQVAAGYAIYGPSVMMVLTTGKGVNGFTLDPSIGSFLLSHPQMLIPDKAKYYAINEALWDKYDAGHQRFIQDIREAGYRTRYVGSMVAEIHRTLVTGGVFVYPESAESPRGKLRLLFEVSPMAFLIEQAGGRAVNASGVSPLSVIPKSVSDRFGIALGGKKEIEIYLAAMKK